MAEAHVARGFLCRARHPQRGRLGRRSTALWVKFKTFAFLPLTLLFALAQAPLIMRYETKEQEPGDDGF